MISFHAINCTCDYDTPDKKCRDPEFLQTSNNAVQSDGTLHSCCLFAYNYASVTACCTCAITSLYPCDPQESEHGSYCPHHVLWLVSGASPLVPQKTAGLRDYPTV